MKKLATSHPTVYVWIQIVLGCLIGGAAYPMFMVPNRIAPGGLTGVATILNHLLGTPVGLMSALLNVPLFLIAWRTIGWRFIARSFGATMLFSFAIDILPLQPVTHDPLLGCVFGGVMMGVGLGLILRGGATTGGTDMMAAMVHRRIPAITTGAFMMAMDFAVVFFVGLVIGVSEALYAFILIYIVGKVVDAVMLGFNSSKACYIISDHWEKITPCLLREMDRGVTQLSARGAYTGRERPVLLCIVSRMEVTRVKNIVCREDPSAFVFITEAHEALGEGFSALTGDS